MASSPPTPFVIVADVRTGSTLLSATLDRHPEIRCRGELFHPEDFPDNQVPCGPRHALSARELVDRALGERYIRAAGFRAMVFHPDVGARPRWAGAWRVLASRPRLRAILLRREDVLAQYASLVIAQQTGRFNPSPEDPLYDPTQRPRVRVDPADLEQWRHERECLYARCRGWLADKPWLELRYEDLTADWAGSIEQIEDFLGVTHQPLAPAKQKQEQRPLSESIANYDELQRLLADRGEASHEIGVERGENHE